ncbi:hypothetical protein [Streptomyces cadmiisoli]|uniref:hypothetical protein n=1 Tax=Streptomyces cadmiisoli TaxID=2184053 RepID=UPI0013A6926B|nr:hypothetical protein [Streptomyces cadmiisoli]
MPGSPHTPARDGPPTFDAADFTQPAGKKVCDRLATTNGWTLCALTRGRPTPCCSPAGT